VSWKAFILVCGKYIQDSVYKVLSESARFCWRSDKTFWCFFGAQIQLPFTYKTRKLSLTR